MRITQDEIKFESSDMEFVRKFGFTKAADMVREYTADNATPFLYDAHQLAHFLGLSVPDLFALIKGCYDSYSAILLRKPNGKYRQVHAPHKRLKKCQRKILDKILSMLPVSQYATAYVGGSTLVKNAAPHIGKRYLLKLDISNFFDSITFERVFDSVFSRCYYRQIAVFLTRLCTRYGVLAQGAPTSPALVNIVMREFDRAMGQWCKNQGISYTRYCDDMTFSSDEPLSHVYQKAKTELGKIGFQLNERKTRFVNSAYRQSVTGLTVNEKVTVQKDYKKALRQEVYYVLKFGLVENILRRDKKEFLSAGLPQVKKYYQNLAGKVAFVLQIEPENTWFKNALTDLKKSRLLRGELMLWKGAERT